MKRRKFFAACACAGAVASAFVPADVSAAPLVAPKPPRPPAPVPVRVVDIGAIGRVNVRITVSA